MANPYVNKVIVNGVSRLDLTSDTVSADKLLTGYTAHDASGASITGSYSPSAMNLNVVAYESEFPASADENTIGIISSVAVSGYVCSNTAPTTGLSEGFVWVKLGSDSTVSLNLSSGNLVYIYPVAVWQYVQGTSLIPFWLSVTAKVYQDGLWNDLYYWAYDTGTTELSWTGTKCYLRSTYIQLGGTTTSQCCVNCSLIDVTNYSTLYLDIEKESNAASATYFRWGLSRTYTEDLSTSDVNLDVASSDVEMDAGDRAIKSIDISSVIGTVSVVVWAKAHSTGTVKNYFIYRVWLEG